LWSPMMTYTKVNVIPKLHGINHLVACTAKASLYNRLLRA